jgi:hypothetical protein
MSLVTILRLFMRTTQQPLNAVAIAAAEIVDEEVCHQT